MTQPHRPDVTTEAVLDLYGRFVAAVRDQASNYEITDILRNWFVENGFPDPTPTR